MYAVVWLGWFGVFVLDSRKMMAFSLLYLFLCSNVVEPVVSFGVCGLFNGDDVILKVVIVFIQVVYIVGIL